MGEYSHRYLVVYLLLMLVLINLVILNLKVFLPVSTVRLSDISTSAPTPSPDLTFGQNPKEAGGLSCPQSCLDLIFEATKSADKDKRAGSAQVAQATSYTSAVSPSEYYIPLGTGSTSKNNWDNITATETLIDPSFYGQIREAYFIASFKNPTQNGQVEARLYNVTDNYPVWNSHVVMKEVASQTITSGKITFPKNAKLYRVQLKSTMSYKAYLDNAKIRIVTE